MTKVSWKKTVEKQLDCLPEIIIRKFRLWVALVKENVEDSDQYGLAVHIVRFTSSMKWMKLNSLRF